MYIDLDGGRQEGSREGARKDGGWACGREGAMGGREGTRGGSVGCVDGGRLSSSGRGYDKSAWSGRKCSFIHKHKPLGDIRGYW